MRSLFDQGILGDLDDVHLLERFVAGEGEAAESAFAVLMRRHGPMVFGVCRRVLNCRHEAEDAFQTTFLVLARKAGRIARREGLANWLYGVALRTARDARTRRLRSRAREEHASRLRLVPPPPEDVAEELRSLLDEELSRLPDRFRNPVLLCELESQSRQEAARSLGIPEGTLSSRLARAKALLRRRLSRRGLGLPAGVLAAALAGEASGSLMPQSLVEPTIRAAARVAAGHSGAGLVTASVLSLTDEVMRTMLVSKLKGLMLAFVSAGLAVTGAAVFAQTFIPADKQNTTARAAHAASSGTSYSQDMIATSEATRSEADRLRTVEQKLDRILEALGSPRGNKPAAGGVATTRENGNTTATLSADVVRAQNPFAAVAETVPAPGAANVMAGDRISRVERRLEELERRLRRVEKAALTASDYVNEPR
jgi:RNA polymerase sigma-70 factor (ECF subfamily)